MKSRLAISLALAVACALPAVPAAAAPTPSPTSPPVVDINKIAAKTLRFAQTLVGKLPSVAARSAKAHGYYLRIISVDGVGRPVTMDYWATRIDLEFSHGRIAKVNVG